MIDIIGIKIHSIFRIPPIPLQPIINRNTIMEAVANPGNNVILMLIVSGPEHAPPDHSEKNIVQEIDLNH